MAMTGRFDAPLILDYRGELMMVLWGESPYLYVGIPSSQSSLVNLQLHFICGEKLSRVLIGSHKLINILILVMPVILFLARISPLHVQNTSDPAPLMEFYFSSRARLIRSH